MNDKLKHFTDNLVKKIGDKKVLGIILVIGIAGIVLIGLSDVITPSKKTTATSQNEVASVDEYIDDLEKKTNNIVSLIDGAGRCKIMITAQSSSMKNFAIDESISQDSQSDGDQSKIKSDVEKQIVMVEDSSGKKQALIKSVAEPEIRGVVVLSEGADDPKVNERITNAVKTLLGVSSSKISVIKMK